ncbi:hypothetical protein AAHH79_36390, partial [Burkholderia pseudomallei]
SSGHPIKKPGYQAGYFAFGPARSARAGDAAAAGDARQARHRAPRYRAISPAARRIARRIAPLTRS